MARPYTAYLRYILSRAWDTSLVFIKIYNTVFNHHSEEAYVKMFIHSFSSLK